MREIAYFWVSSFRNIKNQGINFGSEFIYSFILNENELIISRESNSKYIPNFFCTETSNSVTNITAIVGENGAGKSNFLDALKHALTGDRDWFHYVFIYKIDEGKTYTETNIEKGLRVKLTFETSEATAAFPQTIYYSPALDYKIYPITHDENGWIDISTDWLLYKDAEEQRTTKPEISQVELFMSEEIERQLILSNDTIFTNFLNEKIKIPQTIKIESVANDFPYKIEDSGVRNVPYNYRKYYDFFVDKSDIINDYVHKEHEIKQQGDTLDEVNPYTRKKCYIAFLDHLLKNLYKHFEFTNHFLEEGEITISIKELQEYDYEDAIILFIKNIDLIDDVSDIINFIDYTKYLILDSHVEFHSFDRISWITSNSRIHKFIELKDKYLRQLNKFTTYQFPKSFISYSWVGLSTGEKAMFNLYSRFYAVPKKILEKENRYRDERIPIPSFLYILIDEGELGFHLQWQKEYVNNLINYLPHTLIFKKDGEDYIPKIQIIFTTHSPISLSDIPNNNSNYVGKNGENNYVLSDEERPQKSFGANVHSLMTDSFFLKNGLVGTFATDKINNVIEMINRKNIEQGEVDYIQSIINIIDEPLLSKKLFSMLSEKHLNTNEVERLERMKDEIEKRIMKIRNKK